MWHHSQQKLFTSTHKSRTTLRFILLDVGDLLDTLCVVEPGVPVDFGR